MSANEYDHIGSHMRLAFSTPEGERTLKYLRDVFYDSDLRTDNPTTLAINIGERAVIRHILDILEEQ